MTQKTKERIHFIYGIVLSVLLIAVGVGFALSCLSIYQSGDSPYTAESISAHFSRIAVLTYICIAGVLGGIILSVALPVAKGKIRPRDLFPEDSLAERCARANISNYAPYAAEDVTNVLRERKRRRRMTAILGALAGLSLLPALIWCVIPAHFSIEELNTDIRAAALILLPCAVISMGIRVAAIWLRLASLKRERETINSAAMKFFNERTRGRVFVGNDPSRTNEETASPPEKKAPEGKKKYTPSTRLAWGIRCVILAVGILFVVLGVLNGGMADVLGKAIRICTECIGLG